MSKYKDKRKKKYFIKKLKTIDLLPKNTTNKKINLIFISFPSFIMRNKSHRKPNKLSWSNTRITLLEYCEKKYFLNYYTFALKKTSTDLWKTTLILKKLKSLEMRMGEKTHYLISDYLHLVKKGEDSDENIKILKENLAEEMRLEFNLSKYKNYEELNFDDK